MNPVDRPVNLAVEYSTPAQIASFIPLFGIFLNNLCQMEVASEFGTAYEAARVDRVLEMIELKNTYKYVGIASAVTSAVATVALAIIAGIPELFVFGIFFSGMSIYNNASGISENNELITQINQPRIGVFGGARLPMIAELH